MSTAPSAAWRTPDDAEPESWSFVYAQQVNGYFFPDNCLYAEIDSSDGSVSGFYQAWTEGIPFESPEGIIGPQAALEAYLATFQLQGGYVAVPEKLDLSNPDYGPLAEMGFSYLSTLKLGYTLVSGGDPVLGIDAKTGEPVVHRYEKAAVQYGDLDDAPWAKPAVEALARYGVGYAGDSFAPTQALTQRDLVALLVSTRGYRVDPGALDDAGADDLYRTLRYLNRTEGMAVVMVTHDIRSALRDAAAILHAGRDQWFLGTPGEYLASPYGKRFGGDLS